MNVRDKVWFFPEKTEELYAGGKPVDGTITEVNADGTLTVEVKGPTATANPWVRRSVRWGKQPTGAYATPVGG